MQGFVHIDNHATSVPDLESACVNSMHRFIRIVVSRAICNAGEVKLKH